MWEIAAPPPYNQYYIQCGIIQHDRYGVQTYLSCYFYRGRHATIKGLASRRKTLLDFFFFVIWWLMLLLLCDILCTIIHFILFMLIYMGIWLLHLFHPQKTNKFISGDGIWQQLQHSNHRHPYHPLYSQHLFLYHSTTITRPWLLSSSKP